MQRKLNAEERPVKTIYSLYTENNIFYDKSHYFKIKKKKVARLNKYDFYSVIDSGFSS